LLFEVEESKIEGKGRGFKKCSGSCSAWEVATASDQNSFFACDIPVRVATAFQDVSIRIPNISEKQSNIYRDELCAGIRRPIFHRPNQKRNHRSDGSECSLTSLIPFLLPLLLQPLIVTRPPFHRGASIKRSQLSLLKF
jgi:hypothetical protein